MILLEFFIRLAAALRLGGVIGLERQWRQRLTGLRTNSLVAIGAALFVLLGGRLPGQESEARIASYIVSGIGFLDGGVILKEGFSITGLNTAATLWCTAAVGALAGAGQLPLAALGTMAVLAAHLLLRPLARRINRTSPNPQDQENTYRFQIVARTADEAHIRALLLQSVSRSPLTLLSLESADMEDHKAVRILATLRSTGRQEAHLEQAVSRLSLEGGVTNLRWELSSSLTGFPRAGPGRAPASAVLRRPVEAGRESTTTHCGAERSRTAEERRRPMVFVLAQSFRKPELAVLARPGCGSGERGRAAAGHIRHSGMRLSALLAAAWWFCFAPAGVWAQSSQPRPAQKLRVTPNAIVIEGEQLQRLFLGGISDDRFGIFSLLSLQTGLTFRSTGDPAAENWFLVRGFGRDNSRLTLVLLDGRPVNLASNNTVKFDDLPLPLIDRLVIYPGPVPVRYGGVSNGHRNHHQAAARGAFR